jgi:hypothetical protein
MEAPQLSNEKVSPVRETAKEQDIFASVAALSLIKIAPPA